MEVNIFCYTDPSYKNYSQIKPAEKASTCKENPRIFNYFSEKTTLLKSASGNNNQNKRIHHSASTFTTCC